MCVSLFTYVLHLNRMASHAYVYVCVLFMCLALEFYDKLLRMHESDSYACVCVYVCVSYSHRMTRHSSCVKESPKSARKACASSVARGRLVVITSHPTRHPVSAATTTHCEKSQFWHGFCACVHAHTHTHTHTHREDLLA